MDEDLSEYYLVPEGPYMDYQAGSPVDPRVLEAMLPYMVNDFANPASMHKWSMSGKNALEISRDHLAGLINASSGEIVFTSLRKFSQMV